MLQFILGRAGTGKTHAVWSAILERARQGKRSLLIVPEQFASTADLQGYTVLGDSLHSFLKVCSFRTLTALLEDRFGGGAEATLTDAGRMVLLRRALEQMGPSLSYYSRSRHSIPFCADCSEVLQQLKYCGVEPELLESAAEGATGAHSLRLKELAAIYRAYETERRRTGLAPVDRILRAAQRMSDSFFSDTACFLDGFGEFTAPEAALITKMLTGAPLVTVTLCSPSLEQEKVDFTPFSPATATGVYLWKMAKRYNVPVAQPVCLQTGYRFCSPKLLQLEQYVGKQPDCLQAACVKTGSENSPALICYKADGIYQEAEFAAARCAQLFRQGVPYADMTVICRDAESYLPALQYAFRMYDIPLFTGSTVSAEYAPLAVFLRAGLAIGKNGLTGDGILNLLKTGICSDVSEDALSALENYAYTWRPTSAEWRAPFTRNPAGPEAGEMNEADAEQLSLAEALRACVVPAAEAFQNDRGKTALSITSALYRLALDLGADRTVLHWIEEEKHLGLGSFDSSRMWDTLIGFLDEMAQLLGEEPIDCSVYDELFCVLLRSAKIGQAPHNRNQVVLAAADSVRLDNPDHIIVLGLNEGHFPAPIGESPLLNSEDRALLEKMGAPLSGNFESMVLREEMNLYRALTGARHSLTLSYLAKNNGVPQMLCAPVQGLLDKIGLTPCQPDLQSLALTGQSALELLARNWQVDSPETAALRTALAENAATVPRLNALQQASRRTNFSVPDPTGLRKLLGGELYLSPSRVESYYQCPFSYFLQYILNVRPRPRAELGIPQSGTLVHWLLENLLRDFPSLQGLDDARLKEEVNSRTQDFIRQLLPGQSTNRLQYLLRRICENAVRLLTFIRNELAQGKFEPKAMEQPIGDSGVPSITLAGQNGETIRIVGTVDRVDTMTAEDGSQWLRVVDYKTGSKTFSLDDVCFGINTQMLLYLFTLTQNGKELFGPSDPAGVLYLISDPAPSTDGSKSIFSVDGLIVNQPDVVSAMDSTQTGRYLPGTVSFKEGVFSGNKLVEIAMLGRLSKRLEHLVCQMADRLYEGSIAACPLAHSGDYLRCASCDYRSVCHHQDGENELKIPKDVWKTVLADPDVTEEEGE